VLADLRTLEPITARAVRCSQGSAEVVKVLRQVRVLYDDLMTRAANAPRATLGQRLYTARKAAALSGEEVAGVLDVTPQVVAAAESEEDVGADDRARIEVGIRGLID
jgi:DNA-binding XRE family transcriptional regulator